MADVPLAFLQADQQAHLCTLVTGTRAASRFSFPRDAVGYGSRARPAQGKRSLNEGCEDRDMISRVWLKNFGPFENAAVDLKPFTVILGRNGSGKSMLFWAIRSIGRVARFSLRPPSLKESHFGMTGGFPTRIGQVAFADIVHRRDPNRVITLGVDFESIEGSGSYEVHLARRTAVTAVVEEHLKWVPVAGEAVSVDATHDEVVCSVPNLDLKVPRLDSAPYVFFRNDSTAAVGKAIQSALWERTDIYRLDPSALKSPAAIGSRFATTGNGFPAYLDYIRNEPDGPQAFERLVNTVREICPHLKDVLLPIEPGTRLGAAKKKLAFIMSDPAESIPVALESDGTVLLLAYAALLHGPRDLDTLCLEEPENGIHPRAVPAQVKMLRELSKADGERRALQVLVSTHSRAVFDQITDYSQFRLVRRGADGRSIIEAPTANVHPALAGWAGLQPA